MTAAAKPISAARQRWLDARKSGLGGSDIAAVAGLDERRTAVDVYNEKLGLVPPTEENLLMRSGKDLEPIIFRRFAEVTGRKVVRWPQTKMARSKAERWQFATPDAEWFEYAGPAPQVDNDRAGLLEAKAHGYEVFQEVKDVGLPARFVAQLQWGLGITGRRRGSYAIFCRATWELVHFDVEFDAELFAQLAGYGRDFMEHVKTRTPPLLPSAPLVFIKPVPTGKDAPTVALTGEEADRRVALVLEARKNRQEAEQAEQMTKGHLQELFTQGYNVYAHPLATIRWEQKAGRSTLNEAALVAHEPLLRSKVLEIVQRTCRDSMDRDALIVALNDASVRLDLDRCRAQGAPYEQLTVYARKAKP